MLTQHRREVSVAFAILMFAWEAAAQTDAIKAALRSATEEAQARGIFGAPSFTTADGELFWGNDRLECALAWARKPRSPRARAKAGTPRSRR